MNKTNNNLFKNTEAKLKEGLLYYMQRGEEPTVTDLCSYAKINRSTFYRHHTDVVDLMEETEKEIQHGLFESAKAELGFLGGLSTSAEALEPLIEYIGTYKEFYIGYLRRHAGIPTEEGFRMYWNLVIKPMFLEHGVIDEPHMRYYFEFVRSGFTSVVELWLENGCIETPRELAEIIHKILPQKQ